MSASMTLKSESGVLMRFFSEHKDAHVSWIIVILLASIIINLSYDFAGDATISTVISVAVGLTSLFLAVVAIGQSILSSYQANETSKEIRSAIASVARPAETLKQTSDDLRELLLSVDARSQDVSNSLSEMREMLTTPTRPGQHTTELSVDLVNLENASTYVKAAWFALVKMADNGKKFDGLASGMHERDVSAIYGVISAFSSFSLVTVVFDGETVSVEGNPNIDFARDNLAKLMISSSDQQDSLDVYFRQIDTFLAN